jgi:hypothetical protein
VSEQLRLSFEHRPATGAEDFMPAPCNQEALAHYHTRKLYQVSSTAERGP